jgi:hypothetical protein
LVSFIAHSDNAPDGGVAGTLEPPLLAVKASPPAYSAPVLSRRKKHALPPFDWLTIPCAASPPRERPAHAAQRARRSAHRRIERWPIVALLAVVVGAGTAAAAVIPLFGGSHRLTGAVPNAALPAARLPAGLRYSVPVFPDLEAGDAGWCSSPVFTLPGASAPLAGGGGACGPATAGSAVIVAGAEPLTNVRKNYVASSAPPHKTPGRPSRPSIIALEQAMRREVWLSWFVVSDRVAVIKVNGTRLVPYIDQGLAANWRGLVAFTHGPPTSIVYVQRDGQAINTRRSARVAPVPVANVDPRRLPPEACALGASHLAGLASEWEIVAQHTPPPNALAGPDTLFSCARGWYAFRHSHAAYSAAILLNAQHPADRAPQLPGLTDGARPGDFEEGARESADITARRVDNAWLLVQGPNQQTRDALLHDITATGTALHP